MREIWGVIACLAVTSVDAKEPHRDVDAIRAMDAFGQCSGERQIDGMKLLATLPLSGEEEKQAVKMSSSDCLSGGQLKFRARLLRGAVAEVLLKRGQKLIHSARSVEPFSVPPAETLVGASGPQRAAVQLVLFGECVAVKDPDDVMKLFTTPVESTAELAAFAPLKTSMSACSDSTFWVDRFQMRGYLAEGAYRAKYKMRAHSVQSSAIHSSGGEY